MGIDPQFRSKGCGHRFSVQESRRSEERGPQKYPPYIAHCSDMARLWMLGLCGLRRLVLKYIVLLSVIIARNS